MNTKIKLTVKSGRLTYLLALLLITMPFFFACLNELLGLPRAIRYLLDVAWVGLLVLLVWKKWCSGSWKVSILGFWILLFLCYTVLSYLLQYQSGLYYLWGVRNNFRFYAAFFCFAAFLIPKDADDFLALLDKLFWLNFAVSLVQFFFLDLWGDHLGGLFSTEAGGNGDTNIFFLIIVTKSVVCYLEKRETMAACLGKCAAALIVAAMAELKFFFVEFVLVVVLAVMFTNFTWRKLWILLGGALGVAASAAFLTMLFPSFAGWFSVQWFLETALSDKGYTSAGDLNRLNAVFQINELWLTNGWQRLFGLGLGNCDSSNFALVKTPFFEANGDMHYNWISYAHLYLETGWIGLMFYFGFFVLVYFRARRLERTQPQIPRHYCRIARILVLMCMIISIYNSSLRTEAAYMIYFVLAIPFVYQNRYKAAGKKRGLVR